ncbi:hypothetical protein ACNOIU_06630 [Exiguobacterium mexicanum]|uniref:Uncharacterized protein n=1 Tax=Exiguobacterium mexicanum TaxID=340146 RepID=A0ABT7MPT4_9BACL|nr:MULTISPECIES: hypothetical protein [Exiguobacterium]MDL5377224.1 hypothetical protein [Exiguobacterium mexicanum]
MLATVLFLSVCLGIILSTAGMYLLIKPKRIVSGDSTTVDSIIGTLVLHVIIVCMTTKHIGALLLLLGIGMGMGILYVELYDELLPHVNEVRTW